MKKAQGKKEKAQGSRLKAQVSMKVKKINSRNEGQPEAALYLDFLDT
ncbi:MAG: hypothetical protein NTV01_10440 [Bacteroidia bacterium]|nr:hypothetical protein [Bacteroidia bacterium]